MKHLRFVVVGLCILILLALVVFVWLPERVAFGLRIETAVNEGVVGDVFQFTVVVVNPEEKTGEVILLHELVKNDFVLAQKRAVVRVVRTQDIVQEFPIPDVAEGEYVLRTSASMEGVLKSAERAVRITEGKNATLRVRRQPVLEEVDVRLPVEPRQEVVQQPLVRRVVVVPPVVSQETACGSIPLSRRVSCLLQRAKQEKDVNACEFIQDAFIHDSCMLSQGSSECGLLRDVRNQEGCLQNVELVRLQKRSVVEVTTD